MKASQPKRGNSSNGFLSVESFLNTLPVFKRLATDELREFTRLIHVRWFKKGESVFYAKEPGIGMYFIHEGAIKLYHDESLNGNSPTTLLMRGDFFGELSFLDDQQSRSYTATATEDCCLIALFRPELIRLMDRKPKLGNKIMMILNGLISQQLHQRDEEIRQIRENLSNANFIL
ncbi:cyclic nucleotide-binding domain-containing protein [candidate division KSB1 bacterium]|nr:cyclic nucleotide-binding domain-containing protein [candidate division KSB1 bacterium]